MPHYTTWGGTYVTRPVAREDRSPIQSDGDFNDVVFHNKQADSFMKLDDIRGEFSPSRQVDRDPAANIDRDPGDNFHGNAANDPLPTEEIIRNHGNRSNWDVICDVGTAIKQTSVADALTNYRPFSEMNQGDPFTVLDHGVFAPVNVLRSDNRFVIEPVNLLQGLDTGGMNYAEAVGLDASSVDVVNKLIDNEMPGGDFI